MGQPSVKKDGENPKKSKTMHTENSTPKQPTIFAESIEFEDVQEKAQIVPFRFDTKVANESNLNTQRVQQLESELREVLRSKIFCFDKSQISLLDQRIDSLISQLGRIGYDVILNESESDFELNKF